MSTTILIADDDPLMRTILSVSLGEAARVMDAADGEEALALLKQKKFDLVFLDWDMPKVDGLEVLRTIRASGSSVPVIMVTAEAERSQIVTAVQAGASDYLLKPFDPNTLSEKLRKHCPLGPSS